MVVLMLLAGGVLLGSRAIEDPSASSIGIAVWWQASFSLLLLPGMRRSLGPMDASARRTKWQRFLLYFAVGLSLFALAVVLLSTESIVLWVVASALLLASLLGNIYGLRLLAYGRIFRVGHAEQGSGT
jgi:hypothetical protein